MLISLLTALPAASFEHLQRARTSFWPRPHIDTDLYSEAFNMHLSRYCPTHPPAGKRWSKPQE